MVDDEQRGNEAPLHLEKEPENAVGIGRSKCRSNVQSSDWEEIATGWIAWVTCKVVHTGRQARCL
jgi:hypothetical protein